MIQEYNLVQTTVDMLHSLTARPSDEKTKLTLLKVLTILLYKGDSRQLEKQRQSNADTLNSEQLLQPAHQQFTKLNGFQLVEDLGELKSVKSENERIQFLNLFAPIDFWSDQADYGTENDEDVDGGLCQRDHKLEGEQSD